jgi:methionyl-tRNA formyltransferase
MRILYLGPDSHLVEFLRSTGDDVVATEDPIGGADIDRIAPDFVVSYGYRHILKSDVLDRVERRAVNLHISLLPWNRGADPNFWSFYEDTPKGVTIHYMDDGVDTGDIVTQRRVEFTGDETLRTSYERLKREVEDLFRAHWEDIRDGRCERRAQEGEGSYHGIKDRSALASLPDGFDTPVSEVERMGARERGERVRRSGAG